ncbi:penicillin-binding protein 2, partial [filamentous cyanobacterium CCP5]
LDEPWVPGDAINMSIGQGYLLATPLQVAVMFAIAANGGYKVTPHLLKDGEDLQDWREPIGLRDSTIDILQQGLRRVITSGTAQFMNDPNLPPIAGKTGTAEADPRENHTWFGAYAPADNPEILVVAFGEHSGGGGGSVAAPIVQQFLKTYYQNSE